jgi:hypothetical protein
MQLRRVGIAVAVAVVLAGCGHAGRPGGSSAPRQPGGASGAATAKGAAPAATAEVHLVDLGNRIVRSATVDLEVGKGGLGAAISRATEVVGARRGIYVSSSTSLPPGGPASGEVTFRVPVAAFETVLRELKGLGTYRGERSSTEDVTNQYVDLKGQLTAWRAQQQVYLRLLQRARSIGDVIAVQGQLREVQSNIERLQGQLDYLGDQSAFSTIKLVLREGGAGVAPPRGRLARAWATAVGGLGVMLAAAVVVVVWAVPLALLALLLALLVRAARRLRPPAPAPGPPAA